ncbi:MAG: molybdate ABC transporter substrate-binding protein [Dehalococcoidia bacterium]|nr:molybdate ABC transporter substrate-binding protein [Dehalococcoidia bacterium]MCZ7578259.1 molybdate ABC transporter substrate-binding protein [Dehalococcoidia bacterium]
MSLANHGTIFLRAAALSLLAVLGGGLAQACGGEDDSPPPTATSGASTPATAMASTPTPGLVPLRGEVVVFAASSLIDAFKAGAEVFETRHPGVKVTFNFASSSALATQINEGAPAGVFASADLAQMKNVIDKGAAAESTTFATNVPVLVTPAKGSAVTSFEDLAKPGVRLVLAGPEVPIGRYSRQVLDNASAAASGPGPDFGKRVLDNLKSNEANVRGVLTKVQLGEADAGIVYTTDAAIAGSDVKVIEIPLAWNVTAEYPIAILKDRPNAAAAEAWVEFLLSPDGQAVLREFGFGSPAP